MAILLGDDGTLDTVVICSECGREYRGNFDPAMSDTIDDIEADYDYDAFVESFIADISSEHVCGEDDES